MTRPGPDVLIVGGGVIGCAVAWALSSEGLRVELLEREQLASGASGAAAGMLAPLCEAEEPGPFVDWMRRGHAALEALCPELVEQTGVDPEWVRSGALRVARSEAEAEVLSARAGTFADVGARWLDGRELSDVAPALAPGLDGALYSPIEAHVRPPLLVRAFARAAELRGARLRPGVAALGLLREGERVVGVSTSTGDVRADHVVLCSGWVGSDELAGEPAARLPLTPVRGQIVSLDPMHPGLGPILWDDAIYLVPKRDGRLVAGATTEHVGADRRVTASGVKQLLGAATSLVPELSLAGFVGAWCGLRPDTPDHLPLVGPIGGLEGLVVATGHYRNGVLLSAVTARMVADGILGKGWAEPAFAPDRFAGSWSRS